LRNKTDIKVKTGSVILLVILIVAIFAPIIAPHDPYEFTTPYLTPSAEHILGTNDVGQDIFSELVFGTRVSLLIGVVSALVVTLLGTSIGLVSGYCGKKIDSFLMGFTNIVMSLPSLPLTIILVAYLGPGLYNIIIAICVTAWTGTARVVRSRVMQLKELPFVQIEKTMGAGNFYVMFFHLLPNIAEIVFLRGVLAVSAAMLTEAGLSFLGLGVVGIKSWGGILHYAFFRSGLINGYYWWYLPPMFCISLSVMGFILLSYYGQNTSRRIG
jgi:peptide/nickel transport system permease protein